MSFVVVSFFLILDSSPHPTPLGTEDPPFEIRAMDSHPQSCQLESIEDGGGSTDATDRVSDANGLCLDATPGVVHVNVEIHTGEEGVAANPLRRHSESPPSTGKSPAEEGSNPRSANKGFGLRKWRRRIRRDDVAKEATVNSDSSKALKRGTPTSLGANLPTDSNSADPRLNSEDFVGSVNMPISPGAVPEVDSENSDDRSSRSSTAASAPHSIVKEKNKMKNTSGKDVGAPVLRVPQGKGKLEGIKKARGERIKFKTENSHSSMESDSRSSNFVFMQGACSVTSNGKQNRVPMSSDGESGGEACAEEHKFSEEVQTNYNQGPDGENEDYLRDNGGTGHPTADCDPLVESIKNLQSVHEVLETEVHRFGQLGRGDIGSRDFNPEVDEPSSSYRFDSQINGQSTSLEPQINGLTEKVKVLEIRLKDANNKLKAKETVINEVAAGADRASKIEPGDGYLLELENEVEDHYKQKIKVEVEVEYLVLATFVQKLKVAAGDPISLLNEQKTLAGEHVEVLDKLGKAEGKYYGEILQAEELVKMEKRVCKVTSCFLMELIFLVWVVWLLVMQLNPHFGIVVPT